MLKVDSALKSDRFETYLKSVSLKIVIVKSDSVSGLAEMYGVGTRCAQSGCSEMDLLDDSKSEMLEKAATGLRGQWLKFGAALEAIGLQVDNTLGFWVSG